MTKADALRLWGRKGYRPTRGIGDLLATACLFPFADRAKRCLEIGSGGGFWLTYLSRAFGHVVAADIIPRPEHLTIDYLELADGDYTCAPIADCSFDFVWCYDVFCHLPNSAVSTYVENVVRILKPGGNAVLGFADWRSHAALKLVPNGRNFCENAHAQGWFYCDQEIVEDLLANLKDQCVYEYLLPGYRDRMVHIIKRAR